MPATPPTGSAAPPSPPAERRRFTDRSVSLRAVDRVSGDLRRGDAVLLRPDRGPALLLQAAELATEDSLTTLERLAGRKPGVILTAQRMAALGLGRDADSVTRLESDHMPSAAQIRDLADPTRPIDAETLAVLATLRRADAPADSRDGTAAATRLAKLARLLPALVVVDIDRPLGAERLVTTTDILSVASFDIDHYAEHAAASLTEVARAHVPLEGCEQAELIAFRPADGGIEHLAIVIGQPDRDRPVLARLHSECFTGDLLGSLRCDCGQQLRGAIEQIAAEGAGVVLYLAQEGRGIGLTNKLRAYTLQDAAFDTVDANTMLGYADDERLYSPAARMLAHLGIGAVRLMTNNPGKMAQLAGQGVSVTERVPLRFAANGHNEFYLATKRRRSGHLL